VKFFLRIHENGGVGEEIRAVARLGTILSRLVSTTVKMVTCRAFIALV
jgi:hypothetical protein